jgi:hypothetical protein
MSLPSFKRYIFLWLGVIFFSTTIGAQNIQCNLIYFVNNSKIYAYDPLLETYSYTNLSSPEGASGLGIGRNIVNGTNELTFFCTVDEYLYYYNGTEWINTTHFGHSVNLGGGGNFWYILDGIASKVYRYDGKGNATELLSFSNYAGPFDLVGDNQGNFYMIFTKMNKMVQYDSEGKVLKQYRLEGVGGQTSGGGFAYLDNKIYGNFTNGAMIGTFKGGVIRFSPTGVLPGTVDDFASCPLEVFEPEKARDTVKADSVPVLQSADVVFAKGNIPLLIKDREVKLQSTITVNQPEFDIEIWDKSLADGDSISLNLNGEWILEHYQVVKTKLRMKVQINPNSPNNYLILYAHNLGEISPNTAAVSVWLDEKEYKLTLTSDLTYSGALNFNYEPK